MPVTRSFDVFFDLRMNKRLSKQSWGWCFSHRAHYDVIVMRNDTVNPARSSECYNNLLLITRDQRSLDKVKPRPGLVPVKYHTFTANRAIHNKVINP